MMIEREEYLRRLTEFRDANLIKVVTGIRRCGKSTLLMLYQDYLRRSGVPDERIIAINFEDLAYEELLNYRALYDYVKGRLVPGERNYVFLDEVQAVRDFQRAVDSLYIQPNVDLYVTGSNASLLSGEIATLLSGRYVEVAMLPLSFKEYLSASPDRSDLGRKFARYQMDGSFPGVLELGTGAKAREYLAGIYHTILIKDIVTRRRIQDVSLLEAVIRFMFDNVGNPSSARKTAETMTSMGRKISPNTVEGYLEALTESFVLYRIDRYDVKGKQHFANGSKYYAVDSGLRGYLLGRKAGDQGRVLENIVCLELLRRGNRVYVGKVGAAEVDFITENDEGTQYYQVALTVREERTLERELASLDAIRDHNPKVLLTQDDDPPADYNGIRRMNVLDWLLGDA